MKDFAIGVVVWATLVAAILIIAPKAQTAVSVPASRPSRPTAGDLLRIRDQQTVDGMILTSGGVTR